MLPNRNAEKSCEQCSLPFQPTRRTQRFCSRRCGVHSRVQRLREAQERGEPVPRKHVWRSGRACGLEGCDRPEHASRLCSAHYWRLKKHGDVFAHIPVRHRQPNGTVQTTVYGYQHVYRPAHPNANSTGMIFVHRLIMSEHLGRALLPTETVHHRNGDKLDNRVENLELRIGAHGMHQSVDDRIADAVRILKEYAPHLLAAAERYRA